MDKNKFEYHKDLIEIINFDAKTFPSELLKYMKENSLETYKETSFEENIYNIGEVKTLLKVLKPLIIQQFDDLEFLLGRLDTEYFRILKHY
jgi:hypothetical protein